MTDLSPDRIAERHLAVKRQKQVTSMVDMKSSADAESLPSEVRKSLSDRDRICPVLVGPAFVRKSRMTVHLPSSEAEIKAPPAFLRSIVENCDGSHSFNEIVQQITQKHRKALAAFMEDLLRRGLLVDAANYLPCVAEVAHGSAGWGRLSAREVWMQIAKLPQTEGENVRHIQLIEAPIAPLLYKRASVATFDEKELTEVALATFLWSMYGVTSIDRTRQVPTRRAVASAGGFYLLQFHVVLLRPAGSLAVGIYHLSFPANETVGFERISESTTDICRAMDRPEVLEFAAGVVVVSGDTTLASLKYRNRAYSYLLIEAGGALQNAALAGPSLDIASSAIGGFDGPRMLRLCRIKEGQVLATMVFGARPSEEQIAASRQSPEISFNWIDDFPELPLHLAQARVADWSVKDTYGYGRDPDPWIAYVKAVSEAGERYAFGTPTGLVTARFVDLDGALDPRSVLKYSEQQYRRRDIPFAPFDPRREYRWKQGHRFSDGREAFVLADLVYAAPAFDSAYRKRLYTHASSSGCANATSQEGAVSKAVLELVERDAFMRHWFLQCGGFEIRTRVLPRELSRRIALLERAGCRVSIQHLPSPVAYVCMVLTQHVQRHFTCVASAASLNAIEAVYTAWAEVETMSYIKIEDPPSRSLEPSDVKSTQDHADLYAQKMHFRRADALFVVSGRQDLSVAPKPNRDSVDDYWKIFSPEGVWIDLTLPGSGLRQGRLPVYTARAIVPGLIPITFGNRCLPLGMVHTLHKASLFPHPFA